MCVWGRTHVEDGEVEILVGHLAVGGGEATTGKETRGCTERDWPAVERRCVCLEGSAEDGRRRRHCEE